MYLEQLHYLEALNKYPSISQAATAMFITQPALSRAISKLEDELNLKLLQRTSNGFSLTEDGKIIAHYASKISAEVNNIYNHALKQKKTNTVYFAMVPGLGDCFAAKAISSFQENHPDIQLFLTYGSVEQIVQALKNNTIDFALLSIYRSTETLNDFPYAETLDSSHLFSDKLFYWMKADHPLANVQDLTFDIAKQYSYSLAINYGGMQDAQIDSDFSNVILNSTSLHLYKSLIYCNDAILFLPRVLAYNDTDIENGKIITRPFDGTGYMDFYFVKQKDKQLSNATNDFIHVLLSLLEEYQQNITI